MAEPRYKHRLRYDIAGLAAGKRVLDEFPELGAYPVLQQHGSGEGDKYLRFAIFYADKGSALHERIGDLKQKKMEALRLAGVKPADPRYEAVMAWRDRGVVLMVNAYVRLQFSIDYQIWFHGMEALAQSSEKLSAHIEEEGEQAALAEAKDAKEDSAQTAALVRMMRAGADMGEDKVQRAYKLRHELLDKLLTQRKQMKELGDSLFLDDQDLQKAVQEQLLLDTPAVERRAEGQRLVQKKSSIGRKAGKRSE